LFNASVAVIDLPIIIENKAKYIEFRNSSAIDYELELYQKVQGVGLPNKIKLYANRLTLATITPGSLIAQEESFKAKYRVVNMKSISGEDIIVEFTFNKVGSVENHPYKKEKYPEVK
jgi:hypothetical protein